MGIVSFSNMRVARPAYHTRDVSFLRIAAVFFHSSSHAPPFFSPVLPRTAVLCQTLILSLMRADVDELITVFNCATQHKTYAPHVCGCVCAVKAVFAAPLNILMQTKLPWPHVTVVRSIQIASDTQIC